MTKTVDTRDRREYSKKYYQLHKQHILEYGRAYQRKHPQYAAEYGKAYNHSHPTYLRELKRARKLKIIDMLGGKCVDCNSAFPGHPEVLDLDHVTGEKVRAIGNLLSSKWERLLAEVEKCELVCSNCHRIRTAERRV